MRLFLLILLACLVAWPSLCEAGGRNIPYTQAQAELLVVKTLTTGDLRPLLEPYRNPFNANFYYFEQLNPNPNTSVHVATIAVNRYTGEVWNVAGSVCRRLIRMNRHANRVKAKAPSECEEISND
ncbi:MAG TPA: hypothetical protein VHU87_06470 [Rhizomicrobium sp.]|jgi:hypothetical protein|nr:hypothetical protein [Rhizomicrobium sp.]